MNFWFRTTAAGNVAQQGAKEYMDNVILTLRFKLGQDIPLNLNIEDAIEDNLLKYIFVNQKSNAKSNTKLNFVVKELPII